MNELLSLVQRAEKILRQECFVPEAFEIHPHTSVTRDLGIDTDDISFYFIPALHKEFAKILSKERWSELETVEQIAQAFTME